MEEHISTLRFREATELIHARLYRMVLSTRGGGLRRGIADK